MEYMDIKHISVAIDQKVIITDLSLQVKPGSTHALMGPNGSGKSSLAYALMGHPHYTVTGSVIMQGQDILALTPDKRAKLGLFLAFQYPLEVSGVKIFTVLQQAHRAITGLGVEIELFEKELHRIMDILHIDRSFVFRSLNAGFSGGEKKKFELLQIMVLKPSVIIFDEIDSGLDVDALKVVAAGIMAYKQENPDVALLFITHYQRILDYIVPDYVHVMLNGVLVDSGDAALGNRIEGKGYGGYSSI
jgi:Fe-S cluster assembly ATP-binding protein